MTVSHLGAASRSGGSVRPGGPNLGRFSQALVDTQPARPGDAEAVLIQRRGSRGGAGPMRMPGGGWAEVSPVEELRMARLNFAMGRIRKFEPQNPELTFASTPNQPPSEDWVRKVEVEADAAEVRQRLGEPPRTGYGRAVPPQAESPAPMDGTPRYLEFQDWDLPQSRAGVRPDGTPYARVRGTVQELPGWRTERFEYTKQDPAAVEVLRKRFENTGRANFCEHLALQHRDELKQAGLTDEQIEILSHGGVPDGYEVHHVRPLDGGGTNGFDNLLLMRKRPDHATVTAYQATVRAGMQPGEARMVQWPVPPAGSVVWPPKAGTEPAR